MQKSHIPNASNLLPNNNDTQSIKVWVSTTARPNSCIARALRLTRPQKGPGFAAYAYQDLHVWSALLTCLRSPLGDRHLATVSPPPAGRPSRAKPGVCKGGEGTWVSFSDSSGRVLSAKTSSLHVTLLGVEVHGQLDRLAVCWHSISQPVVAFYSARGGKVRSLCVCEAQLFQIMLKL